MTTSGARAAAGLGSGASVSHSAAPAAAAVAAPKAIVPPAMHAAGGNNSTNSTNASYVNITWVQLTPQSPTVAPGGSVTLTVVALCSNATLTNASCPMGVTYAWSQAGTVAGTLNASGNNTTAVFWASWTPATATVSVTATLNDSNVSASVSSGTNSSLITVFTSGMPVVTVSYSTVFSLYEIAPFTIFWNVSVANGTIGSGTTWVSLNVRDISGNCGTQYSDIGVGEPFCPTVVNLSEPIHGSSGSFSQVINYSGLNSTGYAAASGGTFPPDSFQFIVWATDNNSEANVTTGQEQNMYLVFQTPSGSFLSPLPASDLSTGNISFVVSYTGDYIVSAELEVENATHQIVFLSAVYAVGAGNRTVGAPTPWLAATPGTYTAIVNITTSYGSFPISETLTVLAAGQTIYVNHTSTQTNGEPGGLSPAVTATLLLVVGLIIGLIVALVLGRMMWGAPSQPSSPQPWTPTESGSSASSTESSSTGGSSSDSSSGGTSPKP
ncbi:MAG: hypothetical protein L3K16_01250 [Thermoplasmata archaeon]|nr:hypothetical protein [Thermoplasmata archaeon]